MWPNIGFVPGDTAPMLMVDAAPHEPSYEAVTIAAPLAVTDCPPESKACAYLMNVFAAGATPAVAAFVPSNARMDGAEMM